ncbi:hypothetical protein Anapl_11877 [Anas platyrhynchos]|uniref:Uncharacterized protein n=1 Tax=Anas platyrhynchos TaxID=8839 RepID=R0K1A5_ANAPL|nr:hypothetical protein Anapl_11877 [Anas platyrhynchos]
METGSSPVSSTGRLTQKFRCSAKVSPGARRCDLWLCRTYGCLLAPQFAMFVCIHCIAAKTIETVPGHYTSETASVAIQQQVEPGWLSYRSFLQSSRLTSPYGHGPACPCHHCAEASQSFFSLGLGEPLYELEGLRQALKAVNANPSRGPAAAGLYLQACSYWGTRGIWAEGLPLDYKAGVT